MTTRRAALEPWTPLVGSAPYQLLHRLHHQEARPLPRLPGVSPGVCATAVSRLQGAGYVVRHAAPAHPASWTLTESGVHARMRAATGLTLRQARVLLLIPVTGCSARAVSDAYTAVHGASLREQMYQTLRGLVALGFAEQATASQPWMLTAAGTRRRAMARRRVALSAPPG